MPIRLVVAVLLGALAGYGFHRFVGCRSGTCAIWANPYLATLYGAVLGLALGHDA
ncbi:MAG: DUF6132 family protein [Deltaproteobacteria bacterium]|nr:DUF6132 family protein [Deltaproteobacteria bacterium]